MHSSLQVLDTNACYNAVFVCLFVIPNAFLKISDFFFLLHNKMKVFHIDINISETLIVLTLFCHWRSTGLAPEFRCSLI